MQNSPVNKIIIKPYNQSYKKQWDGFISQVKKKHFFFQRAYMEYHSDKFEDFSLLFFDRKDNLLAVLPANKDDKTLHSHQGLTFGGLLISEKLRTEIVLEIFQELSIFCKLNSIERIFYKCIPYIYHKTPADEDTYALFRFNAKLIRRDISSALYLRVPIRYSKGRKWTVNKAKKQNIKVGKSQEYQAFWKILVESLNSRHQTQPVHKLEEIKMLATRFPKNISLFVAKKKEEIIAGTVIFENEQVVRTQYLVNTPIGKDIGALDLVIDYLLNEVYQDKKYFDFGTSNEEQGKILNLGLIAQKEGFGARAVVHDFYEWNLK